MNANISTAKVLSYLFVSPESTASPVRNHDVDSVEQNWGRHAPSGLSLRSAPRDATTKFGKRSCPFIQWWQHRRPRSRTVPYAFRARTKPHFRIDRCLQELFQIAVIDGARESVPWRDHVSETHAWHNYGSASHLRNLLGVRWTSSDLPECQLHQQLQWQLTLSAPSRYSFVTARHDSFDPYLSGPNRPRPRHSTLCPSQNSHNV